MLLVFLKRTIAKVVALATISPIITGMGGNAGTQTLTIVVRGLSLGELDKRKCSQSFIKKKLDLVF